MRVLVITHPTPVDIKRIIDIHEDDIVIGVDQAILALHQQDIRIDLAVGDFDSLADLTLLEGLKTVRLEAIKDVTDTHQALIEAMRFQPDALYLIGGVGGERIEHFVAHILLFDTFPTLIMQHERSTLFMLATGTWTLASDGYISFFAYPEATLSLKGFEYDLTDYHLQTYDPLGISNQITKSEGIITIHQGRVLVIMSDRDSVSNLLNG